MKTEGYIELINSLNANLFERFGETEHSFNYLTDGNVDIITFDDIEIWNSENDIREYIEETNIHEPLETFIPKEFNRIIAELHSLQFMIRLSKDEIDSTIEQFSRFLIHPYTIRVSSSGYGFEVVVDGYDVIFEAKDSIDLSKFCAGFQIGNEAERFVKE